MGNASTPKCSNCGADLLPAASFCDGCGAPVQRVAPPASAAPVRRRPVAPAVLLLVVVAVGAAAWWLRSAAIHPRIPEPPAPPIGQPAATPPGPATDPAAAPPGPAAGPAPSAPATPPAQAPAHSLQDYAGDWAEDNGPDGSHNAFRLAVESDAVTGTITPDGDHVQLRMAASGELGGTYYLQGDPMPMTARLSEDGSRLTMVISTKEAGALTVKAVRSRR